MTKETENIYEKLLKETKHIAEVKRAKIRTEIEKALDHIATIYNVSDKEVIDIVKKDFDPMPF